jgi:hypothetical protein
VCLRYLRADITVISLLDNARSPVLLIGLYRRAIRTMQPVYRLPVTEREQSHPPSLSLSLSLSLSRARARRN